MIKTKFFYIDNKITNKDKLLKIKDKALLLLEYRRFISFEIHNYLKENYELPSLFYLITKYAKYIYIENLLINSNTKYPVPSERGIKFNSINSVNTDKSVNINNLISLVNIKDLEYAIKAVNSNYVNKQEVIKQVKKYSKKRYPIQCVDYIKYQYYKKNVTDKNGNILHAKGDLKSSQTIFKKPSELVTVANYIYKNYSQF